MFISTYVTVPFGDFNVGYTAQSCLQDGRQRNSHSRLRYFRDEVVDVTEMTQ